MSALQAYKDFQTFRTILADLESVKLTLYMNRCDNEMSDETRLIQQHLWKLDCRWGDDGCDGYYIIQWNPDACKFITRMEYDYQKLRGINWEFVDEWQGKRIECLAFINDGRVEGAGRHPSSPQ